MISTKGGCSNRRWSWPWESSDARPRSMRTPAAIIGPTVTPCCWPEVASVAERFSERAIGRGHIPPAIQSLLPIWPRRFSGGLASIPLRRSMISPDGRGELQMASRCGRCLSDENMTREIGIGVIGMGWMGLVHSRSYRTIADRFHESGIRPRLVICADEVEARARDAQERLGFEECTTDWKQVVAHPE